MKNVKILCSILILTLFLGSTTSVFASECPSLGVYVIPDDLQNESSYLFSNFDDWFSSSKQDYGYLNYLVFLSGSSIYVYFAPSFYAYKSGSFYYLKFNDSAYRYEIFSSNGEVLSRSSATSSTILQASSFDNWHLVFSSAPIPFLSSSGGSFEGTFFESNPIGGNNNVEYSYNSDIGYLKNVSCYFLNLTDSSNKLTDQRRKFTWSSSSSAGVNLLESDYQIQFKIHAEYGLQNDIEAMDDYIYPDLISASKLSFSYSELEMFPCLTNCYAAYTDDITKDSLLDYIFGTSTGQTFYTYYFRIISHDGTQCGDWIQVKYSYDADSDTYHSTTSVVGSFDDDNNFVELPETSSTSTSGTGVGKSEDDAMNNFTSNHTSYGVSDSELWENAEDLISGIGNMPKIISAVFSFLPSWCLKYVAVSFGLIVVLILYKLLRG